MYKTYTITGTNKGKKASLSFLLWMAFSIENGRNFYESMGLEHT